MVELKNLSEGDKLKHKESGKTRYVIGFVKDFSGERDTAELGHKSDQGNLMEASMGPSRADSDELNDWEVVEE